MAQPDVAGEAFIPHIGWLRHDTDDHVILLLRQGAFEVAEQAFVSLFLRPGDIFIDCGAHIGLFSVLAWNASGGEAEIISIEANPRTARHLKHNLERNGVKSATAINAAVWRRAGNVTLLESGQGRAAFDHIDFEERNDGYLVASVTLSDVMQRLDRRVAALVKIDVEGAEPEVILGGIDTIRRGQLPLLMVEFTQQNLQQRGLGTDLLFRQLEEHGYSICEFDIEKLELVRVRVDGPIWHKNLFASQQPDEVNARLKTANCLNRKIATDIIARGRACERFKELEDLDNYKHAVGQIEEYRRWAERSDALVEVERATVAELRQTLQEHLSSLSDERRDSRKLREWAERSDALVEAERARIEELQRRVDQIAQSLVSESARVRYLKDILNDRRKLLFRLFRMEDVLD